ncbi:hypothetical protein M426DRAFT_27547 [Hypoxylon sp. CI-4A]|nr:hypothetical protein M426DRAFT_27547 [Hypoxylon sp. CI-4A]
MVAKWGPNVKSVEPDMMYYVQSMAEMEKAVPLVYRSLTDRRTKFYIIVMEYIDGHNILDLWDSYTVELKAEASEKAAKLVEKMQSETSPRPYPGPIGIARIKTLVHKDFPMPLCIGRESFIIDSQNNTRIVGWGRSGYFPPAAELAVAEHLISSRNHLLFVKALLLQVPHIASERRSIRLVAQYIDDNPSKENNVDGDDSGHDADSSSADRILITCITSQYDENCMQ